MKRPARLRNRILLVVAGLALAISLVFSLYTVAFTYAVEDAFLGATLREEAAYLEAEHARTGRWPRPRDAAMRLHASVDTLPAAIAARLREEPERVEFPGDDGAHYHLMSLAGADGEQAWLVYDARARLVVRPVRDALLWLLAGTTLALLAVSLVAGYWAARRTTRRLERLAAAVAELDPARLPAAWPQAADDEVGIVTRGLEAMTQRLRAFVERERSFTRDASHELRTPLAVIRSAGDQLARQPELREDARRHADLIRESTARLEQTVATLLALAREAAFDGEAAPVRLLPLIEQTIVDHSPRLEGKPVRVEVDVPASASMSAPSPVVRIVLANLIGNAFAHTSAGTVRIAAAEGLLRIVNPLADDAGEAGDSAGCRPAASGEGFGFGLGIVRRLCERFGLAFELRVENRTVVAVLPLAAASGTQGRRKRFEHCLSSAPE